VLVKWNRKNKKLKPQPILDELEKAIKWLKEPGKPDRITFNGTCFNGFGSEVGITALRSLCTFPKLISESEQLRLTRLAIAESSKLGILTEGVFLQKLALVVEKELKDEHKVFHILTSLSISTLPYNRKSFNDSVIRLLSGDYPKKYSERDKIIKQSPKTLGDSASPQGYAKVIVTVRSNNKVNAATKGLDLLDFQRAIFCLLKNPYNQIGSNDWRPINVVRTGKLHSVHNKYGRLIDTTYWYEPNFKEVDAPFNLGDQSVVDDNEYLFSQLAKCRYSERLKSALVRYVRAFDETDPDVALTKLWGALETLACSDFENYDPIIRRCSFMFEDVALHRQMLEYLRETRNRSVHSGDTSSNARRNCFLLGRYFKSLFLFHIRGSDLFNSWDEANRFLDSPTSKEELVTRQKILAEALKYRYGDS